MNIHRLVFTFLLINVMAQIHAQSPPLPLPPKHKFDEGPITPAPCAAPAGPLQENAIFDQSSESSWSFANAVTVPLRKWTTRYNAPMNGDDAGYEIAVDDSGAVYVAGRSLNPESNYDGVAIKYNKDGQRQWVARYNSLANHNDAAYALAVDDSGNVYLGGYTLNADFNHDFLTIKYNRNGVRQWVARYNGPANWHDGIFDLQIDQQNNVYVAGYSYAQQSGYDWVIIKYNSAGVQQWLVRYNGPGNGEDCPYELALDDAANLYLTGYGTGKNNNFDFLTAKFNRNGVKQWAYHYNATSNKDDVSNDLVLDRTGNVCVTGKSHNPDGNSDYLTIKFDNNGVRQWIARYNRPNKSYARGLDVAVDSEGSFFVTGRTMGNHTGDDWVTIKYTSAGVRNGTAHHTSRGFRSELPCRILIDATDHIYVAGYSYIAETRCRDYLLICYSRSLSTYNLLVYDGPGHLSDVPYDMALDAAGNIYLTGTSQGAKTDMDIATIKYDLEPFRKAAAVSAPSSDLPASFALAQNYPNPFQSGKGAHVFGAGNPATSITFRIPADAGETDVRLEIFTITGRLVRSLVQNKLSPGTHRVQWDGRDEIGASVPAGVYFYRLRAGHFAASRKLVLVR